MADKPVKPILADSDLHGNDLLNLGHVTSLVSVLPSDVSPSKPLVAVSLFPIAANSLPNGPTRTIVDMEDFIHYFFGGAAAGDDDDTYEDDSYSVDTY